MSAHLLLTSIHNLVTQLELHPNKSKPLEVVECTNQNLAFVSEKIGSEGQMVSLTGTMLIGPRKSIFEATGRISSVTKKEDGQFRFEIHLNQYDKAQWKRFNETLNSNQSRADRIFASIRYEE